MVTDSTASQDPERLRKILVVREHARADAWLRRDRRALDALLAPDFVETNRFGRFERDELLDRLFPALTLNAFVMEEPAVRISANTTAIIRYRCHEEFTMNGERIKGTFSVTATYTFTDNQYRLSAWESSPAV